MDLDTGTGAENVTL